MRSRGVETILSINLPSFQRGRPEKDRLGDYRYGGQWEASGNWNTAYSRCSLDIISVYEHLSRCRGNHAARAPWITPSLTYTPRFSLSLSLSLSFRPLLFALIVRHLRTLTQTPLSTNASPSCASLHSFLRLYLCLSSFTSFSARRFLISERFSSRSRQGNVCLARDVAQRFWAPDTSLF